jgi:hypothetical protein
MFPAADVGDVKLAVDVFPQRERCPLASCQCRGWSDHLYLVSSHRVLPAIAGGRGLFQLMYFSRRIVRSVLHN